MAATTGGSPEVYKARLYIQGGTAKNKAMTKHTVHQKHWTVSVLKFQTLNGSPAWQQSTKEASGRFRENKDTPNHTRAAGLHPLN